MSHDRQSRWYEEGPLKGERKKVRGITLPLIRGAMLRFSRFLLIGSES